MKTLTIAHLKADFSSIINEVRNGEEILVEYGKKREKVAIIIPYKKYNRKKRKIGILKGKASFSLDKNFKISDEELLSL
jgi:antitoxin (DNA-binding transcriptional repressor) of toxin-antitoxin stability system